MLFAAGTTYLPNPFDTEAQLEDVINEVSPILFGSNRVYLDIKKKIGAKGKQNNIPDGYLIDLSSPKTPALYVVENEIAKHDPMNHIAVQVLQFSLSFKNDPPRVKKVLKDILAASSDKVRKQCEQYAAANHFGDIDNLLSRLVYESEFRALVIVDELDEDLEIVLAKEFRFQAEVITIARFTDKHGNHIYEFRPFLSEITGFEESEGHLDHVPPVEVSEIDTIVVPARDEGFFDTFVGENRWYAIKIHASMIPKIKYIAAYRVAPLSSITHIADRKSVV